MKKYVSMFVCSEAVESNLVTLETSRFTIQKYKNAVVPLKTFEPLNKVTVKWMTLYQFISKYSIKMIKIGASIVYSQPVAKQWETHSIPKQKI